MPAIRSRRHSGYQYDAAGNLTYDVAYHYAYDDLTTFFDHADWIGTERARSGVAGTSVETCTNLPYGDDMNCSGYDPSPLHFTGAMRDTVVGLDYMHARYYYSTPGRWMLPDWSAVPVAVPYANLTNPQTLNLYTYVGNNLVTHTDVDGHYLQAPEGGASDSESSAPGGDAYASVRTHVKLTP